MSSLRRWAPWILTAAAGALYALCWRAYYVGFFNDDAFFIIGARALLQGRFVELNDPRLPDLVNYLPGYPMLLAPVAAISGKSFVPLQSLSIVLTAATVALSVAWAGRAFGFTVGLATGVLVAFNPLTASLSGTVLSDIPYLFFSLLVIALAFRGWSRTDTPFWLGLGLLSGFCFLLRPIGGALGGALVLALLTEKRWREAGLAAAAFAIVVLPYLITVRVRRGFSLAYADEFLRPYGGASAVKTLLNNWIWNGFYYPNELWVRIWYRWWPAMAGNVAKFSTIAVCALVTLIGFRRWTAGPARAALFYLAAYVLVHLSWSKQAGRYLLPILPLMAAGLFCGWEDLGRKWKGKVWLPLGAAALAGILCIAPVSRVIRASLSGQGPLNSPPEQTLSWIRDNTTANAVFGAEMDGSLHILTGRYAVHVQKTNSPELFLAWADGAGVDYVLVASTRFSLKTRAGGASNDPFDTSLLVSLLEASASFERVFTSIGEGTAVYRRVRPPQPAIA